MRAVRALSVLSSTGPVRRSLQRSVVSGVGLSLVAMGLTVVSADSAGALVASAASASVDDPACALRDSTAYPSYVVPAGVHSLIVDAYGAAGHPGGDMNTESVIGVPATSGGGAGGLGAHVSTTVPVTPGDKIWTGRIEGGRGGRYNGNIPEHAGRGGEGIWVGSAPWRGFCPADGFNLLAVAGGGGGGGGADLNGPGGTGGNAEQPGNPGGDNQNVAGGGGGAGTMTGGPGAGGAGGNEIGLSLSFPFYTETPKNPGEPGDEFGHGGSGGNIFTLYGYTSGGGGGGGYYGGGGGGASGFDRITASSGKGSGGGGGGGSYPAVVGTSASLYPHVSYTPIYDALLTFTASPDPGVAGQPVTLTATVTSPIAGQPLGGGYVAFADLGDPDDPARQTTSHGGVSVDAFAASSTVSVTVPGMARGHHGVKAYYTGFTGIFADADNIGYAINNAAVGSYFILDVQGPQSITFTSQLPAATASGATYTPTATSTYGLPVSMSIDASSTSVCSITQGVVSFLTAGTCTIDADQAGDDITLAAPQVQQTVTVAAGAAQKIIFTSTPPDDFVHGDSYAPTATGGGSGQPVVFSSDACHMRNGVLFAGGGGTCIINANQAGGNGYAPAPQQSQTVVVQPAPGEMVFNGSAPASPKTGDTYTVKSYVDFGNLGQYAAVLTLDPDSASCALGTVTAVRNDLIGWGAVEATATVTYTGIGDCIINSNTSRAWDTSLAPVEQAQQVSTVAGAAQHITFTSNDPPEPTYGGSTTVAATSSSGLPVTFTSATPATCSVSGADVVFISAGECDISANQSGDTTTWAAAPTVTKKLTVGAATLTVTAPSRSAVYGTAAPAAFAPSYDGFVADDDATSLTARPLCTPFPTSPNTGSYTVTCSGAADPNYTFVYVDGTDTITAAPLTITASSPSTRYGTPATVDPNYDGLVNGDAGPATPATCQTTAATSSPVGTYPATCSGAADPNYAISYRGGTVTVTPAALTVTADNQSVQYSDQLPTLTASYAGFVNGQDPRVLTGTLVCGVPRGDVSDAGQVRSPAASYAITCSGLGADNYTIAYVQGTLTVSAEDTVVRLAQNNPHAVAVLTSGGKKGNAPAMTFSVRITEVSDGSYGDISKASPVTFTLAPVGRGDTITCIVPSGGGSVTQIQPATTTTPGFEVVSCTVPAGTPINLYRVTATVDGEYYQGSDDSVLTVYDSTAGGTNGAGTIINPSTARSADIAYSASYLKNGKVQGKLLYISRDSDGNVVHVLKGNVMSTMAISGNTAWVTGKATVDGVGNYSYVLTGIDNATDTDPNPSTNADQVALEVTDSSGNPVSDLTFSRVDVSSGNIYVGK